MTATEPQTRYSQVAWTVFTAVIIVWSQRFTDYSYSKDVVLCIGLCVLAGMHLRLPSPIAQMPRFLLCLALLILCGAIVHSVMGSPVEFSGMVVRRTTQYLLVVLLAFYLLVGIQRVSAESFVRSVLVVTTIVVSILAWIQYFNLAPGLFPVYPEQPYPIYSVFGNQNLLGGWIALGIPALLAGLDKERRPNLSFWTMLVLFVSTLLLTGSRSAWLAAFIGCAVVVPRLYSKRTFAVVGSLVFATAILVTLLEPEGTLHRLLGSFGSDDVGAQTRVWIWLGAGAMIRDHAILGIGPGNFPYLNPQVLGDVLRSHESIGQVHHTVDTWLVHSTPLELVVEFGLLGASICAGWVVLLVRGRSGAMWGSAVAFALFAALNSINTSTPHLLIGLLIIATLPSTKWVSVNGTGVRQPARAIPFCLALVVATLVTVQVILVLAPDFRHERARAVFRDTGISIETQNAYNAAVYGPFPSPYAQLELALLYLNDENSTREEREIALGLLEKAEVRIDTGELHLAMGTILIDLGLRDEALASFEQGMKRWPRYRPGWEQWIHAAPPESRSSILERAHDALPDHEYIILRGNVDELPGLDGQQSDDIDSDRVTP